MKVAKAQGRLRGKQPKLKPNQAKHLLELYNSGEYTQSEFAELFGSDDPRCTGPSRGCDPSHQNCSGHSHISRIVTGAMRMLLRARPDRRPVLAGRSLPTTADSPSRLGKMLDHVTAAPSPANGVAWVFVAALRWSIRSVSFAAK